MHCVPEETWRWCPWNLPECSRFSRTTTHSGGNKIESWDVTCSPGFPRTKVSRCSALGGQHKSGYRWGHARDPANLGTESAQPQPRQPLTANIQLEAWEKGFCHGLDACPLKAHVPRLGPLEDLQTLGDVASLGHWRRALEGYCESPIFLFCFLTTKWTVCTA